MKLFNTLCPLVLSALPLAAVAFDSPLPARASLAKTTADVVTIRLKDGGSLRARIIDQDPDRLKIVTVGGLAMELDREAVHRGQPSTGSLEQLDLGASKWLIRLPPVNPKPFHNGFSPPQRLQPSRPHDTPRASTQSLWRNAFSVPRRRRHSGRKQAARVGT